MSPSADQPEPRGDDTASSADHAAARALGEPPGRAQPDDPTASGNPAAVFPVHPVESASKASDRGGGASPAGGQGATGSEKRGSVPEIGQSKESKLPSFDAPTEALHSGDLVDEVNSGAQTVISKRPVAAPEEFYRSMPLAELAEMLEGRQLDHFAVEQMIGGGGMGAVFRGRDLRLDRVVAIKVIPASRRDAETLRRFRQEAQAAARLDHPNIARVYYVGEADRWNYIVFEFIDGVNIRDLVQMEGPLSIDDAVFYCRQVAEALEHARIRDVVHRDIKPSNILVTATGHIKVVDMGLARDTSMDRSTADETASGITLGTFDYISPEQARNPRDADTRSDLYSLGCSLFFMLTGAPPFPDGTALQKLLNHGSQPPPDPRTWREDISDQLHDVLLRLMAKRPSQRYQKPIELVNDLVLLAESEGLARAQSPGAFMFTPTVVQRSLLEANLPWMVALAFLMGSTLWLQSMQATSGISQLPRITSVASSKSAPASAGRETAAKPDAPDVDRAKESPATGDVGDEDSAAKVTQVAPAALPDEVLVVAAQQPADVAPMQWERSLDEALLRAASESVVREIEIRGNAQLTQPIVLADRSVVIRGVLRQGVKASELRIDLGRTTQANPCLIELQGSSLRFDSMQVVVEMGGVVGRSGVIRMTGQESRTAVTNCEVNALESGATNGNRFIAPAFSLVHVGGSPAPTFGPFFPSFSSSESFSPNVQSSRQPSDGAAGLPYGPAGMAPLGGGANSTSGIRRGAGYGPTEFNGDIKGGLATDSRRRVEVSNSVLRLHGGLIALDDTQRKEKLELVVRQSLVVSSREVLFAKATNGEGNPRFVRAELALSTFISPAGFATFTYEGGGNPQLGLNRQSDSCAFWSAAGIGHLTLVGARRESLLGNFVLLDFQGQRNAYDRAIEEICQSNPGAPQSAKFGFQEAGTDGWFAERGSEFEVAWPLDLGSINFSSPSEISAIDRQTVVIKDDMFQPGVNAVGQ